MVDNGPLKPGRNTGQNPAEAKPEQVLASLMMRDGLWGELALDEQWEDALAVFYDQRRRHFLLRGRGMSKSTDAAAMAISLLLTQAPPQARMYCYAADAEQAGLMIDSIAEMVDLSSLGRWIEVGARTAVVRSTGASLAVQSSDGASALGKRPYFTILDEIGAWPDSANYRRLYAACISAVPKVPGSRLMVISTAGEPGGIGHRVFQRAEAQPKYWRVTKRPGPSPWWDEADHESMTGDLTPSDYRRLILCDWAEGDDALTSAEDITACTRAGSASLPWQRNRGSYVAALDIGTRRDLTALAVGHAERREAGRVVVIDRVLWWRPSKTDRVDLAEVEEATFRLAKDYKISKLLFDRMQAEMLTANLARRGVRSDEYVFSASGVSRLAKALVTSLRDRAVELPDDEELLSELGSVRVVETGQKMLKMSNPAGTHDDVATAVGMVIQELTRQPDLTGGRIFSATQERYQRTVHDATPRLARTSEVRQLAKKAPAGVLWFPRS